MRLVGPGSLGVVNTATTVSLNATFIAPGCAPGDWRSAHHPARSGSGCSVARRLGSWGSSTFASLGSRADVSTNDLLEYWEQDEPTSVVVLYVEMFGNPERFTRIARRVSRRKPILVVKGRRRAERLLSETRTHTAAALRGDAVSTPLAPGRGAAVPQRRGTVRCRRFL